MTCSSNVLIIGINGFLGKTLKVVFEEQNFTVYGTTHNLVVRKNSLVAEKNIFQLKIGDIIDNNILLNDFSAVVYLAHDHNIEQKKLIDWYKKIFCTFKNGKTKQIYISSYSANEKAISKYGQSKYQIEQYFLENHEYCISPGLIIGKGGIVNKIVRFVCKSPVVVIPVGSKDNLVPIVSVDKVCSTILDVIRKDLDSKNYNIYSYMISLENLIKNLIQLSDMKKYLFRVNGNIVLCAMTVIENIGIKLPVSSDSLMGFIANQEYSTESDIQLFGDDLSLDDVIKRAI